MVKINYVELLKDWEPILREPVLELNTTRMLIRYLQTQYKNEKVYPTKQDMFRAFKLTSFDETRVVILGQDPYPNHRATGLAFGNDLEMCQIPSPSLRLMQECIERDFYDGLKLDFDYSLVSWAKQGVLLLNTALTVRKGEPGSHSPYWRRFISNTLEAISNNKTGIVFLLLGGPAASFSNSINANNNFVLKYHHPAYSARRNEDWNCPHFKEINSILENQNGKEFCIKW